jgi:hypothetical protein
MNARGDQVTFSTVTDGTLLSTNISWTSNTWHHVCLTYGPTNTTLYIDGAMAASGPGIAHYPDAASRSASGLNIGTDVTGTLQAKGLFDEVETFNYPLGSAEVTASYASDVDGDGLLDRWELQYFGHVNYGGGDDPDSDGLNNNSESQRGTNPADSDTDDDGINDGAEVTYGTNPLTANPRVQIQLSKPNSGSTTL